MTIEIIAEIGISHEGDMILARELIDAAKEAGVKTAKFQLYDVDASFPDKKIIAQNRNWYEEVKKIQLSRRQAETLARYCDHIGIEFLASAADLERLSWLEEFEVKRHKVGSSMNKNKELIDAMANTGKEILLSCQRRSDAYIPSDKNIKVLYCIPMYPTPLDKFEFSRIGFPYEFQGFSDHTQGIEASVIAMARGAKIIEKHFCLKRDNSNPDMVCSIEPDELKRLVEFARKVEEVLYGT